MSKEVIGLRLEQDTVERVEELAGIKKVTKSEFMRQAIKKELRGDSRINELRNKRKYLKNKIDELDEDIAEKREEYWSLTKELEDIQEKIRFYQE